MPSKKYIPNPIEAYEYKAGDKAQLTEFEKIGLHVDDANNITSSGGDTQHVEDGDYIVLDNAGNLRCFSKSYFESHYTVFGAK